MVGGVVAAPYTGGASLGLVQAGANVVANDEKAEGAKKAAAEQEKATQAAIKTQQDAARTSQQAFQPYTQTGSAAIGTLGSMLGLQTGPMASGATGPPVTMQLTPEAAAETTGTGRMALPREDTPQARATQQTRSSYGGASLGDMAGGMVQMRAPTGEVRLVPKAQAPFYAERGALELGGVA